MSKKAIGFVLLVVGLVIMAVSLFADVLGVSGNLTLGWKQLLGTAIGIIVALVGVWLAFRKPQSAR